MKVEPVIIREDGSAADEKLATAVENWLTVQSGEKMKLKLGEKAWAVVERNGKYLTVKGVGTLRSVVDTMLHAESEIAAVKLYHRMHNFLEDQGIGGKEVLVHIDPKTLDVWKKFLEAKGIKPANRWRVKVGG